MLPSVLACVAPTRLISGQNRETENFGKIAARPPTSSVLTNMMVIAL